MFGSGPLAARTQSVLAEASHGGVVTFATTARTGLRASEADASTGIPTAWVGLIQASGVRSGSYFNRMRMVWESRLSNDSSFFFGGVVCAPGGSGSDSH